MPRRTARLDCRMLLACAALIAGAAAVPDAAAAPATPLLTAVPALPTVFDTTAARADLGRRIFFDTRFSEPRGTSCASCHDPARAFSGNHGASIGVPLGSRPAHFGARNTPSVLYLRYNPALYFYQDDDSIAAAPVGGLFADGRVDSLAQLVKIPLLNPREMNNRSVRNVVAKLAQSDYADAFRKEFGAQVMADTGRAMTALGRAVAAFLQSDEMAPFSSKYDAYIRGRATLSAQESRGLALFKDPDKGNCISCHKFNDTSSNPARSLFTDFGYDAIGVPRNRALPANRAAGHFDLGLCATAARKGWPDSGQWCGYFRTPSLRNVALRESFMHNGIFSDLRDAVAFYATRSTKPGDWYRHGTRFDDVPRRYRENVNISSMPYNRRPGQKPALDNADIDAIVAFLRTLTDERFNPSARDLPR